MDIEEKETDGAGQKNLGNAEVVLNEENNFPSRHLLMRSPPRTRTHSMSHLEQKSKRKRMEGTEDSKEADLENESRSSSGFKGIMEHMSSQIKDFEKVLSEMYKPKKELIDISGKLVLLLEKLQTEEMKSWLEKSVYEKKQQEGEEKLENETTRLRNQMRNMEALHREELERVSRCQVQCESCREEQRKLTRREGLTLDDSYENYKRITEGDWQDEILSKIQEHCGDIWETPSEHVLILPSDININNLQKTIGSVIDRLGGKEDLKNQKKTEGEVAMMVHSLAFPDDEGNLKHNSRMILYPIFLKEGANEGIDDETILRSLTAVKSLMTIHGKRNLVVPEMEGITGIMVRRILEFLFAQTGIEITLVKRKVELAPKTRQKITGTKAPKRKRTAKQDALLVKMPNVSYADLLKSVKQTVDPGEIGVEIKDLRKTRSGELLLTVQHGSGKLEALKEKIQETMPDICTSIRVSRKVLHIKDMDEVTTMDDIKDAISKCMLSRPEDMEVKSLRPAFDNKQNVTVVLSEADAIKLTSLGKIKIGWKQCRVLERKTATKCFKCWRYGHRKAECRGPDRESRCLKCTQEGHMAVDCTNNPFCIHCQKEGHQSGNPRCPKNRGGKKQEVTQSIEQNIEQNNEAQVPAN